MQIKKEYCTIAEDECEILKLIVNGFNKREINKIVKDKFKRKKTVDVNKIIKSLKKKLNAYSLLRIRIKALYKDLV